LPLPLPLPPLAPHVPLPHPHLHRKNLRSRSCADTVSTDGLPCAHVIGCLAFDRSPTRFPIDGVSIRSPAITAERQAIVAAMLRSASSALKRCVNPSSSATRSRSRSSGFI